MATTREDWMEQARREQEGRELLAARVAELEAELSGARVQVETLTRALEEAQRESEGRRKVLVEKAEECAREWRRAEAAESRLEALARELEQAQEAEREARAAVTLAHAPLANVWLWQGDGGDEPASLACPVVMSADTLRGLLLERDGAISTLESCHLEHVRTENMLGNARREIQALREAARDAAPVLRNHAAWDGDGGPMNAHARAVVAVDAALAFTPATPLPPDVAQMREQLKTARRFQESAARDRDAQASEVERLTRQLAQMESDLHAAREQLEGVEKDAGAMGQNAAGRHLQLAALLEAVRRFQAEDKRANGLECTCPFPPEDPDDTPEPCPRCEVMIAASRALDLAADAAEQQVAPEGEPNPFRPALEEAQRIAGERAEELNAISEVASAAGFNLCADWPGPLEQVKALALERGALQAKADLKTESAPALAALALGRKALETLVERKSACGDPRAECPLQDAHKPGDDVQQAIAAMRAAERTGL